MAHQDDVTLYPCATPGCVNKRTKAEGGTVFTICDTCWDECHPGFRAETQKTVEQQKPEHMRICLELIPFQCCACGKLCCKKHGIPLPDGQSLWKVESTHENGKRCTFCADAGR